MRILCAMDGSNNALRAGRMVAALPLEAEDEVIALTVVHPGDPSLAVPDARRSQEALQGCRASVRAVLEQGHTAERILRTAEAEQCDLIVVGSRGLTGLPHLLLGSVAEKVARHSKIPVLVARSEQAPRIIWLGTDGSEGAQRALDWLKTFPGAASAEVTVVSVLPFREDLARAYRLQFPANSGEAAQQTWVDEQIAAGSHAADRLAEELRQAQIKATSEVRHGDAAQELLSAAQGSHADLIVVGAQGLSAVERFFIGSVSERVLRHAHCSVAVVH